MESNIYTNLRMFWGNVLTKNHQQNPRIIEKLVDNILMNFALNRRIYFSIFNLIDFKKEFSTPNTLEVFGIEQEEYNEHGTQILFSRIDDESVRGILTLNGHLKKFLENVENEKDVLNCDFYYCGVKYHHKIKGEIQLLWKCAIIETDEKLQPIRILSTFQDISHLMKNDLHWFRGILKSPNRSHFISCRCDNDMVSNKDALTEREKEILNYISENKDTEEIAKLLFISKTTVNNHRQNMLNKLGAKDATALVQLAKLTKLI